MSTTVISQGCIVALAEPLTPEKHRQIMEDLYGKDAILGVNDEGTLLYTDENNNKRYSEREFCGDLLVIGSPKSSKELLIKAAADAGLQILVETIQPYTCIWYNGCESPITHVKKAKFLNGNI